MKFGLKGSSTILSPETLLELRRACALILKETGPSDEDYAVIVNQPDPLDLYKREQKEIRHVRDQASASQTSLPRHNASKSVKRRDSKALKDAPTAANRPSKPLPPPVQASKHDSATKTERISKPLPPTHLDMHAQSNATIRRRRSSSAHNQGSLPNDATQASARTMPDLRPKPLATAYADNARSSKHNSRSTTYTNDDANLSRRDSRSTAHTSAGFYDGQPWSSRKDSVRQSPDELPVTGSSAVPHAHLWIDEGFGKRKERHHHPRGTNPDYAIVPTLHPEMYDRDRRPERRSDPAQPPRRESSRPQSRTSGIMDNIREGIRDYVKPRPSVIPSQMQSRPDSRAPSRSESRSSSRPPSRGSFSSGRSWLKGAANGLRRKGSWSSFRSVVADEDEADPGQGNDKGLDLNRRLPPLPGLDQYKEPKKHIAQLMSRKTAPVVAPAPIVAPSPPAVNRGPDPPPRLASLASGHSSFGGAASAQPPPPPDATPPSRSTSDATQQPRIPFSDESPPAELKELPRIQPVEPGWLHHEVQRRMQGRLSPALSNDAVTAVVATAAPPPVARSPVNASAERRREDDIRRIARRPVAQDRQDSATSQVGQARALSALGRPRTTEVEPEPESESDHEHQDYFRAATSPGHSETDHGIENRQGRNGSESRDPHSSIKGELGSGMAELKSRKQGDGDLRNRARESAMETYAVDQSAQVDEASAEGEGSMSSQPVDSGRPAARMREGNTEQREPQGWHSPGSIRDKYSGDGMGSEREPDERASRKIRQPVDAANESAGSTILEPRLPLSDAPPEPPTKSPAPGGKVERAKSGKKLPPPSAPVQAPRNPKQDPSQALRTASLLSATASPPSLPSTTGKTSHDKSKSAPRRAPGSVVNRRRSPSEEDYEVLPDPSLHNPGPMPHQAPMLASQQRWGTQPSRPWVLGSPAKRSPSTASSNPKDLSGAGEGKTAYARIGSGGVLRRSSVGGYGAGDRNGSAHGGGHGGEYSGVDGGAAVGGRRAALGRLEEERREQHPAKGLRNRLSRLLGGSGGAGRKGHERARSRNDYLGEVRIHVANTGE